jgi:hypothetical protein
MMGGALYEKYIGKEDDHEKLLNMALDTLKKQLNFNLQPKKYQVSIMKVLLILNLIKKLKN